MNYNKNCFFLFVFLVFGGSSFAEKLYLKGNIFSVLAATQVLGTDENLVIVNQSSYEDSFRVYIGGEKTVYEDFDEFLMEWACCAETSTIKCGKKWKSKDDYDFSRITHICIFSKSGRKYRYIPIPNDDYLHIIVSDFKDNESPY